MNIKRTIKFTGKNLNDVFGLPCVRAILKIEDEPMLSMIPRMMKNVYLVNPGDTILEYDDGTFGVESPEENHLK
jgi:hypothetical protein